MVSERHLFLGLLSVCLLGSCASPANSSKSAWAERVLDLRRSADEHLSRGELGGARSDLLRILALDPPAGDTRHLQLVQDAHFALGSIHFGLGRYDRALDQAEQGLRITEARSIFTANLHALRAMCLESTARELDAISDYQAALAIHKDLFDAALREHR